MYRAVPRTAPVLYIALYRAPRLCCKARAAHSHSELEIASQDRPEEYVGSEEANWDYTS
jgi:hypothetical protein